MTLTLYYHPLASFCWKALIALYENDTPFERTLVDLGDSKSRGNFEAVWPMTKMPVLVDATRKRTIAESTIIIEYLDAFRPGPTRFTPADADLAARARMWDRFHDNYLQTPMQKIVGDALRPAGASDPYGVEEARTMIRRAYHILEREMAGRAWALGDVFSLADCAAAPALFYADVVEPLGAHEPILSGYLARLKTRAAFARTLSEAEPYFPLFPLTPKPRR
jgi:glutathione S-transferase